MVKTRLAELLKEKNMTQKELSLKAEARPSTISDLCNGTAKTISFKLIDSLCTVLECQVGDLLQQVEEKPKDIKEKIAEDVVRLFESYESIAGTKLYNLIIIPLNNDEYETLQIILNYIMSINSDNGIILSIGTLKNKIINNLTLKYDSEIIVCLPNDYFLDDFTQTFYYIVIAYNHIEEFKDCRSAIESIYLNFADKIDTKTFDKILELTQRNYNLFIEKKVTL